MPKTEHKALVSHVQQLEKELHQSEIELRHLRAETKLLRTSNDRAQIRLKTLQTLSLTVFSGLSEDDTYRLATQVVVQQVGYASAFVVRLLDGHMQIAASYHATRVQVKTVQEQLIHCAPFIEAYREHRSFSTYHDRSAEMLALRAAFKHDEIIGHPIRTSDHSLGYLIACEGHQTHPEHGIHAPLSASTEEVDFLAALASLLAYAVGQGAAVLALEAQNAKLKQLDELKDSFMAITSHQLRTPLSIVKWILSLLREDEKLQALGESGRLVLQAYEANERLIHVVNDLLNASRIQEGKLTHTPVRTNCTEFLYEIVNAQQMVFEARGVRLTASVPSTLPDLGIDTMLMREAVQNLIDNALDYNRADDPTVRIWAEHIDNQIRISVANPGEAIPLDERSRIFLQFYRSPQALRKRPNGSGLGLFLARAIVEAHSGSLTLDSSNEVETVFSITLPVHPQG